LEDISEFHVIPNLDDRERDEFNYAFRPTPADTPEISYFYGKGANWILNTINESIKAILELMNVKNPTKVLEESGLSTPRKSGLMALVKAVSSPRATPRSSLNTTRGDSNKSDDAEKVSETSPKKKDGEKSPKKMDGEKSPKKTDGEKSPKKITDSPKSSSRAEEEKQGMVDE